MSNDLRFTDEQAMILDSARDFCRNKSPIAAVREQLHSETGYDASVWREMVELGWLGLAIPEEFGGSGLASLSVDERATLTNMATKCSGKSGICEGDEALASWIAERRAGVSADAGR